jgi:hypothetical protein
MPLVKSKSPAAVGENIKTEEAAGKEPRQALAIALSVQDKAKARKNSIEAAYKKHMKSKEEKDEPKSEAKKETKKDEMEEM